MPKVNFDEEVLNKILKTVVAKHLKCRLSIDTILVKFHQDTMNSSAAFVINHESFKII